MPWGAWSGDLGNPFSNGFPRSILKWIPKKVIHAFFYTHAVSIEPEFF
jgi:hypothetical protein